MKHGADASLLLETYQLEASGYSLTDSVRAPRSGAAAAVASGTVAREAAGLIAKSTSVHAKVSAEVSTGEPRVARWIRAAAAILLASRTLIRDAKVLAVDIPQRRAGVAAIAIAGPLAYAATLATT